MKKLEDTLLIEGARSYLDATNAIVHYQQEVQKKCGSVMKENLGEYAAALGVGLKNLEILELAWPEFEKWEGTWACIGVAIEKKQIIRGIGWWEAYCCLEWQVEEPRFYCYVGEWYRPKKLAAVVHQKFHSEKASLWHDDNDVGIYAAVKPDEAKDFDEILEALWSRWIKCWTRAGGMKMVFRD